MSELVDIVYWHKVWALKSLCQRTPVHQPRHSSFAYCSTARAPPLLLFCRLHALACLREHVLECSGQLLLIGPANYSLHG